MPWMIQGGGSGVQTGSGKNVEPTAATVLTSSSVVGDTNDRFRILADGTLQWGPGNTASDVRILRLSQGVLGVDNGAGGACGLRLAVGSSFESDIYRDQGATKSQLLTNVANVGWQVTVAAPTTVPFQILSAASQSADLQQWLASDGVTVLLRVESDGTLQALSSGSLKVNGFANSAGALAVTQTGSGPVIAAIGPAAPGGDLVQLVTGSARAWGMREGAYAGGANPGGTLAYGTGAPVNANGTNGDIYLRVDGGAGTTIYQRRAGAWAGIV